MRLLFGLHIALLLFFSPAIFADALKKVLILDVINIDHETNFNYLEASLTEALKDKLRKNFLYNETSSREWLAAAKAQNLVFLEESYTRTYALELGVALKQDIAISGGFRIRNRRGVQTLVVTLFLLDVQKTSVIDTITIEAPISADLFAKVDELAELLSRAAAKVLPAKNHADKNQEIKVRGEKSLGLIVRMSPLTIQGRPTLDENNPVLRPSAFRNALETGFRFHAENVWQRFGFWTQILGFFSTADIKSSPGGLSIAQKTFGASLASGGSYSWLLNEKWQVSARVGAGYMFGIANLDFSSLSQKPVDANSEMLQGSKQIFYGPILLYGGDVSYDLNYRYYIEAGIYAQSFIDKISMSTTLGFTLGCGWRF